MAFTPESLPYYNPHLDRRVCLITGGNSGIGYHTVLNLYLHGFVVYMAGRDSHRMEKAISHIKKDTRTIREKYTPLQLDNRFLGELHSLKLDLLDLSTVDSCVRQFQIRENSLNILILNAGIMAVPYEVSKDGFEVQLQTSYISHFLLTDRLMPMLEYKDVKDPRVVFLSSLGHWFAPFKFNLDSQFNYWPNLFWTLIRYGMAKCVGIQFMKSLARRHSKVLSVSVHPGVIFNTNLFTHLTEWPIIGTIFWFSFQILQYFFGVSVEEGSWSTLKCAASDELDVSKDNGNFYFTFGEECTPSFIARNETYGEENWAWTIKNLNDKGFQVNNL